MKRISIAVAFCMSLALPVSAQVSDEARAHIKCFANLTQGLFTPEMQKANPSLERQRQRHEELFVEIGRRNLKDSNLKFGADHYLGGYEQRMFDDQINKLRCDNPSQYGECTDWLTKSEKLLSAIGMKFYERENCEVLLR
jgi:hypothetical protein